MAMNEPPDPRGDHAQPPLGREEQSEGERDRERSDEAAAHQGERREGEDMEALDELQAESESALESGDQPPQRPSETGPTRGGGPPATR